MPPCSRKISRRGRDDAILEKRFVLAGFGGLREIAYCTKSCDEWSGNVGNEPLELAVRGLQLAFSNADASRRTIQAQLIKNIKINVEALSCAYGLWASVVHGDHARQPCGEGARLKLQP